jgi:hypothetical protein
LKFSRVHRESCCRIFRFRFFLFQEIDMSQKVAFLVSGMSSAVGCLSVLALMLGVAASTALAGGGGPPNIALFVPEMDPAGAAGALALVTGGLLMVTDRLFRMRRRLEPASSSSKQ